MARNKIGLQVDLEPFITALENSGRLAQEETGNVLKASKKVVTDALVRDTVKANYPAKGKYSTGDLVKSIDKNYEQWSFLEKFKGVNTEFNEGILKAAEEQGVNLRKVFGKAISNTLESGTETREILLYATGCFSIGRTSYTEDVQLVGTEGSVGCWCKSYLVELGEDFWQIKFASFVGAERGESIVHYSKAVLDISDVEFDAENGKAIGWTMPKNEQFIPIEQLRGI